MPLTSNPYRVAQARRYAWRVADPAARRFAMAFFRWLNDAPGDAVEPARPADVPPAVAIRIRGTLWRKLQFKRPR